MFKKVLLAILVTTPFTVNAQSMWGSGMWGGMQSCPYQTRAGNGATSVDDGTQEIQEAIKEAQQQLKDKKSAKKKAERDAERAKKEVSRGVGEQYAEFIFTHIENNRKCAEYQSQTPPTDPSVVGEEGERLIANRSILPVDVFTSSEWNQVCDRSKNGSVLGAVCSDPKFAGGRGDSSSCKKGLVDYRKNYLQAQSLQSEIERLEQDISQYKEDLKDAKADARENQRLAQTEGGICIECMQQNSGYQQKSQTDWGGVAANIGTGLLATYMGYQSNKMTAEYNSNIGWPTQSYPSWSYGFPYLAAGIYGAMGGGTGQGSFGCGGGMGGTGNMNGAMGMMGGYGTGSLYGSMGGGGAFGYPAGMMGNIAGGGMFNSGMSPWGMNGYGNIGMSNIMGMNGMSGYGNMMGSMMGGMMGMGGMTGYGNMMGSMMGMNGYGNMMGNYGLNNSSMQYQQQMMQLQLQQYQTSMQYQQQYQQQNLQRYQTMASLQQEMYSLMSRMQNIQYGIGTTNYIGSGSLNSLGTTPYGSSLISTLPGTTSTIYSTSTSGR